MRRVGTFHQRRRIEIAATAPSGAVSILMTTLVASLVVATWVLPGSAQSPNYAETMAASDIGYSARVLAMAGVQVGLADEPSMLFGNPAGLALLQSTQVTTLYTRPYGQADHFAISIGSSRLALGGSFTTTSVESTGEYGEPLGKAANYQEISAAIGGGVALLKAGGATLYGGAAVRYLRQTVADVVGSAITADAGLLVQAGSAQVGLSRRNLSVGEFGVVRYSNGVEDPLEPSTTLGIAVSFGPVLVAADHRLEDHKTRVGAEAFVGRLALRGGVATASTGETEVSLGAGVGFGPIRVDYAYLAHPALPDSHRLSLSAGF